MSLATMADTAPVPTAQTEHQQVHTGQEHDVAIHPAGMGRAGTCMGGWRVTWQQKD